jgi:hypothetical protein
MGEFKKSIDSFIGSLFTVSPALQTAGREASGDASMREKTWPSTGLSLTAILLFVVSSGSGRAEEAAAYRKASKDAYVSGTRISLGNAEWRMGTSLFEMVVTLKDGRFGLASFLDKGISPAKQYLRPDGSALYRMEIAGSPLTGWEGGWRLESDGVTELDQGELRLDIMIRRSDLVVGTHFIVYPETSIVRQWTSVCNAGSEPLEVSNPHFLDLTLTGHETQEGLTFGWFTGAYHFADSQRLVTEPVDSEHNREFASHYAGAGHMPLMFLHDPRRNCGVYWGWDYLGPWSGTAGARDGNSFHCGLQTAELRRVLRPEDRVELPRVFLGTFRGDPDDMGNFILDWQYQYYWQHKDPAYFAQPRLAVDFPAPWIGTGGTEENWSCRLALDLYFTDLARYMGAGVLWDDAGWYDEWGTWRGPAWGELTPYLKRHDMRFLVWFPTFMCHPGSRAVEHLGVETALPDGGPSYEHGIDQSRPAATAWQRDLLDEKVAQWGDFQWRWDGAPGWGLDPLAADQEFRKLVREFITNHPGCAIDAGSVGGASWMGVDLASFACSSEMVDGQGVRDYAGYHASMLLPPDLPHWIILAARDKEPRKRYSINRDRAHLRMHPVWFGDPGTSIPYCKPNKAEDYPADEITALRAQSFPDIEQIRYDWDLYHYMLHQGVAGRWCHVFRPNVSGDDPVLYFQRMNRDGTKGVILTTRSWEEPERMPDGPVTVFPKGLQPDTRYDVHFDFDDRTENRTGGELMTEGIRLDPLHPGEIVFLNLPGRPGSGNDQTPPSPPGHVTRQRATYVYTQGLAIEWEPGEDENWLSGYEVFRVGPDGEEVSLGRVSRGTFLFDRSQSVRELEACHYEVCSIDGDGNRSPRLTAEGLPGEPEPETHFGFSGFADKQGYRGWHYEWSLDGDSFQDLTWTSDLGYEGRWTAPGTLGTPGPGAIGRTIMLPGPHLHLARTFVAPREGECALRGTVRRDVPPGVAPGEPCRVRVLVDGKQVWPDEGWALVDDSPDGISYEVRTTVARGSRIVHLLAPNRHYASAGIAWNPIVAYAQE